MKPHSWGWLCNRHSLNNLLINYSSILATTNFTLASSAGWGLEVGAFQFLHPQILKKYLCRPPATIQVEMCLGEQTY